MAEYTRPTRRRTVSRRAAAVEPDMMSDETSAAPGGMSSAGADCGHSGSGCAGGVCQVHYVGPTSQISDHHTLRAAHASSHIWAAAIVSGLAVVLTGVVAYSSVEASTAQHEVVAQDANRSDMDQMFERINSLEAAIQSMKESCAAANPTNKLPVVPPSVNR